MTPERARELASRLSDEDRQEIEQTGLVCGRGGCKRMGTDPAAPFREQLAAERSARAALVRALKRYGQHDEECAIIRSQFDAFGNLLKGSHCACGLLQARALLDQQPGGAESEGGS